MSCVITFHIKLIFVMVMYINYICIYNTLSQNNEDKINGIFCKALFQLLKAAFVRVNRLYI